MMMMMMVMMSTGMHPLQSKNRYKIALSHRTPGHN